MELVSCPSCGAFSPSDSGFCNQCKAPLPSEEEVAAIPSIPMAAPEEPPAAVFEEAPVEEAPPAPEEPPAAPPFEAAPDVLARIEGLEAQIASKPHAPAMYLSLAKIYLEGKRQDLAVATLERCLAVDPLNVYVRHRLGQLTGAPAAVAAPPAPAAHAPAPAARASAAHAPAVPARTAPAAAATSSPISPVALANRPAIQQTPNLMRRMTGRQKAIAAGVVGIVVLGIAVKTFVFPSTRPLVVGEFRAFAPTWSPSGKALAFLLDDGRGTRLAVYDFAKGGHRSLAAISGWDARGFAWSPDGARIAYAAPSEEGEEVVSVVDVATGQSRRIAPGRGPAWSLDGRSLLMTCSPERPAYFDENSFSATDWTPRYCTADAATGEVRRSAVAAEPGTEVSALLGKAVSERSAETEVAEAAPVRTGDGEFQDMAQSVAERGGRNFAEGSKNLTRELSARRYDERRRAARNVARLPYGADVVVTDVSSGTPTVVTSDGHSAFPSWTPDGARILFATDGPKGIETWSMNPDGSDRRLVLGNGLRAVDPSTVTLSADGKWVFFVAPVEGDPGLAKMMTGESPADLHVAKAGGSSARRLSNKHPFKQRYAVSPDGRRVAYEVLAQITMLGGAQRSEIWLMNR